MLKFVVFGIGEKLTHLFVVCDRYPAFRVHCKAVWFSVPLHFHSNTLVCINSQYPTIRDINNVEISRRSVYWSFEEYVLEGSRESATPFRFAIFKSAQRISIARVGNNATVSTLSLPVFECRVMQ
jgi:hypothetical protein